jgi:signal transduction histidine kinase
VSVGAPSTGGRSAPADALARLQAVSDAALAHLTLDDLLDELLTRIRELLVVDTCAVLLLDDAGGELVARAAKGLEEEVEQGVRIPIGAGFAGRIAAGGHPVIIPDVDHSYVLNPILREKGIKSLLGVPLIAQGRTLGVIHVGTLTPRLFEPDDVELLELAAQRVAAAVDRAQVFEQVVRLSELQREFIALAAHELRTPATAVYGLAATLHERRGQLPEETVDEIQTTLYEQAERLRQLVEQLLDLSRLDASTLRIEPRRIQLRTHLEEVVSLAAAGHPHSVRLEVPDELEVVVDPTAVERIVANLVVNALRHGEAPVVVWAEQSDQHVRIYVQDSGKGVAPEFVPYLFERFHRSPDTLGKSSGTGLGLSIARSYARAHGGDVLYHGATHGAKFEFVVPAESVRL